ncbi:MAG: hypothetical protein QM689_10395 [Oscillospiraceae bacterium]
MRSSKFALLLASPVLAPAVICAVVIFFLLIVCGWFFVAAVFFSAAGAAAIGLIGIAGAFYNAGNGFGAVLVILGSSLIALGLAYPLFCIATEFLRGYRILSDELMKKGKELEG